MTNDQLLLLTLILVLPKQRLQRRRTLGSRLAAVAVFAACFAGL
jgi:hypothetical protein